MFRFWYFDIWVKLIDKIKLGEYTRRLREERLGGSWRMTGFQLWPAPGPVQWLAFKEVFKNGWVLATRCYIRLLKILESYKKNEQKVTRDQVFIRWGIKEWPGIGYETLHRLLDWSLNSDQLGRTRKLRRPASVKVTRRMGGSCLRMWPASVGCC